MFQSLLSQAGQFSELIALVTVVSGGAAWVIRMIMNGKKQVQSLFTGQQSLAQAIREISQQLKPNGGSSLFDIVKETSNQVATLKGDLQRVKAWQWSFSQASKMPMWETDEKGCWCRVNIAMQELTGRAGEQLHNSGWENAIPPSPERSEVWHAWHDAVARSRNFEHTYTIEHSVTRKKWRVKAVATPIIATGETVAGFIGRFEDVSPID